MKKFDLDAIVDGTLFVLSIFMVAVVMNLAAITFATYTLYTVGATVAIIAALFTYKKIREGKQDEKT